uniref:Uncharacterized protein n=1 Tax=Wuchereria bancrofti TaxID=6293 RepID=A0A1I8EL52_WUCBA
MDAFVIYDDVRSACFNVLQHAPFVEESFGDVKQKVRNGKYELSMLIQAAVVCGIMGTEIICFYFLLKFAVKLTGKKAEIPTNIFINCYVIFNNFILPTVNLIFVT